MEQATSDNSQAMATTWPGVVIIAGPTASGKSSIALDLAIELGGVIINADAMQAYRDLPILTAQPVASDQILAPHRLYGFMDSDATMSAAIWADLARREIAAALSIGKVPIVVGGTGLYLRALINGLSPIPPVSRLIQEETRALLAALGSAALHTRLAKIDPVIAARLHPNDAQRIARAWDVHAATGIPLSQWQGKAMTNRSPYRYLGFVSLPARPVLYDAIGQRVQAMVEAGVLREVAHVMANLAHAKHDRAAGRVLGFKEFASHLEGEIDLRDAVAAVQKRTRQYAKRQVTWVRHQLDFSKIITLDRKFEKYSVQELAEFRHKIRSFLLTE